jgi:hypothetical protein
VAMTRTPVLAAYWTAMAPTPPVAPATRRVWPALRFRASS